MGIRPLPADSPDTLLAVTRGGTGRRATGWRRVAGAVAGLAVIAAGVLAGAGGAAADGRRAAATAPPPIATLGALNRWIDTAVQAKGSASFTEATLAGSTTSERKTGVVRWVKGTPTFSFSAPPGRYVGTMRAVVLADEAYAWGDERQDGRLVWWTVHEGSEFGNNPFWTQTFFELRKQLNPARMFPAFTTLPVTRSRIPVTVDGVRCWVYTARMSVAKRYSVYPTAYRPTPRVMVGGTSTVSWSVDAQGLPHRFVVVDSWPKRGSTRQVTTYGRWGSRVTVTPPSSPVDLPII